MLENKRSNPGKTRNGFSLIEIIFFTSILSIVLVASVGYTVRLVLTMTHNRHKLFASHYSEEVVEWLNGERESDWDQFTGFASTTGTEYCMNNPLQIDTELSSLSLANTSEGCPFNGVVGTQPLIFRRTLLLQVDDSANPTQVSARVRVSWNDNGKEYSEELNTVYSFWE